MLFRLGTLLGIFCVLGLLAYYTTRLEPDDDPHLYYEIAGKTLGRPADEAYLRFKREGTAMGVPLPVPPAPTAPAGQRSLPYRDFAVEYPPLALGVFVIPRLFTNSMDHYLYAYQAMMAGAILGTALVLGRMLQRLRPEGQGPYRLAFWLTAVVLILTGSYVVRRFDVLLSLTVAASVVSMLGASPFVAGLWLGAGAAAKLWPVMLLPILAMYDRRPATAWRLLVGFGVVPVVSHLVLYPFVGTSVLSYLQFHAGRGLQLESLWSSVLIVAAKGLQLPAQVRFDHGSANLIMPRFVPVGLWASFVTALGTMAMSYAAGYWAMRPADHRLRPRPRQLVMASLLLVGCLIITAKVLSPQYLFWLFPLALVVDWRIAALYLAALGMTHLYFPYRYEELMEMRWWATGVLLVRNLVVVGLVGVTFAALTRGYWPQRGRGRAMLVERVPMGQK